MPELSQQSQADATATELQFIECRHCHGFGYQVTPGKQHIRCKECSDNPSVYGLHNDELIYWGQRLTTGGIRERAVLKSIHIALNGILLVIVALGIVAFVASVVLTQQRFDDLTDVFTQRSQLMGFAWFAALCMLYVYYRLMQESASRKRFEYSEEAEKKQLLRHPAERSHRGYHKLASKHKKDIAPYFTQEAVHAIEASHSLARQLNHHVVTPLHILTSLLETQSVRIIAVRLGISMKDVIKRIGVSLAKEGVQLGEGLDLGVDSKRMLLFAYENAVTMKRPYVDVTELLMAIVTHDKWAQDIFYDLEIEERMVRNCVQWIYLQRELRDRYSHWSKKASRKPKGIMDRAMTARPSPLLQSISSDYTVTARMGGFFPMIGRKSEMDQVVRILRDRIGSVLLVGPPGVGKSVLLEGLAERMAAEDVPKELQDKRFVVLDPGALIANAKGVGAVEGRMQQVIQEMSRAGNIVLGIEDVHHLVNMRSTSGSEDVAGILMNAMSSGLIKVVATTTTQEYQQFIQNRGPLLRRFRIVQVNELDRDDAIEVLEARAGSIEYKYKTFLSYGAVESAVDLSTKFIQDRYLPAKALDIVTEAASLAESTKGASAIVTREDVAEVVSQKTNVKVTAITEDERKKLLNLEQLMHERVVGQDAAVDAIASALRRSRQGLRDAHRPIANFLFLGPTGVGKTETAKAIAEIYFGNEANMIRVDMSEYQTPGSVVKLIGANGQGGTLTEAVRLKPFSLILLDELEKADRNVLNVFLQVMEDARLTDGTGRTVDLSNCMIIATSNAGTQAIQNSFNAGLSAEQIEQQLIESGGLSQFFAPEFLNRFDDIVVFKPLTFEEVVYIADLLLAKVAETLLKEKGITMEVTPEAAVDVAQRGYDPLYGARPLRRVIQDTVDDALAKLMLAEKLGRRDIVVLREGGEMEIRKADVLT